MRGSQFALLAGLYACACEGPPTNVDSRVEADGHYLAAQSAYLKGDFAEAHRQFDEVRRLNPTDPRLAAAQAEVLFSEGKLDEALGLFERAAAQNPRRGTNWSRLASLYVLKKRPEQAARALDKALELNPNDFSALELRADVALAKGQLDDAVELLARAADAAPDAARAELLLRATAQLDQASRGPEALALLEAAQAHAALPAAAATDLGDRLVIAGRLADAVKAYTRAAELDATDPTLWELVGELELKLGHLAEAEAAYRRSLAVKDRGVVHVALARLCQSKKEFASSPPSSTSPSPLPREKSCARPSNSPHCSFPWAASATR